MADPGESPGGPDPPSPYFKTKLSPEGPKHFFGTPAPLYLRVWRTAPHPLSQSLVRHLVVSGEVLPYYRKLTLHEINANC